MSTANDHLAERVKTDPWFLAHPLAEYARSAGLDDAGLAARLGCRVTDLTAVRLCRAPRPDSFGPDLMAVSERFGMSLVALVAAVQHGTGLAQIRKGSKAATGAGWTIAAQDRENPE